MATEQWDVIVIGAGAAGIFCAIEAARRGRSVLLLDHGSKVGRKILVSGGGRCNFTNSGARAENYHSSNPHFCRSALSRYPPARFIEWVRSHGIAYHEKKLGQLFCDGSARELLDALLSDLEQSGAVLRTEVEVQEITGRGPFRVFTARGSLDCDRLVLATGGLSLPKLGATGLAYRIARQYGLPVVPTRPALVPLTLGGALKSFSESLAGVSCDVSLTANGSRFRENLLFTHRGLSGPAVLQISSCWQDGDPLEINWLPDLNPGEWLEQKIREDRRRTLESLLAEVLPRRLAQALCASFLGNPVPASLSDPQKRELLAALTAMVWKPAASEGYRTAEVTRGGVDTHALESKTMASREIPGLYFIGECVDVTGWLGGYNFQWAWASGWAAGQAV
ncbi:MAG: NAD(P)/FAD-dependent oxidoreductase [Candidatus Cloacimonetes bacterium]|nr:NAD(P)/FAD-dependent oxidoreductase [Candidatus Cloacimonadota bacterium]